MRRVLYFSFLALFVAGCAQETLDVTGQWAGEARLTVDGEQKDVPLRLEFVHTEQTIEGTIQWDNLRRTITAGSSEGPELRFESATDNDTILFNGLFRADTIEGRFTITYKIDPEPFPGRFSVARQE